MITGIGSGRADITASTGGVGKSVAVRVRPTFRQIWTGMFHSCGIGPSQQAYCWGNNFYGQVGNGSFALLDSENPTRPVSVAGGNRFAQLSAGDLHTCGLLLLGTGPFSDGPALCWGDNREGQLGTDTGIRTATPELVAGGIRFTDIRSGAAHTCGLVKSGHVYCWGRNSSGEFGDSTLQSSNTPVIAMGGKQFRTIALGGRETCGITLSGTVLCNLPYVVGGQSNLGAPFVVPSGSSWLDLPVEQLVVSRSHKCAVSNGSVWCLGDNTAGQLGDGTLVSRQNARPATRVTFIPDQLTAGAYLTCAVATGFRAYCWGGLDPGDLGDGTSRTRQSSPTEVAGSITLSDISAGSGNVHCGVSSVGGAYCWGSSPFGALGGGAITLSLSPSLVLRPDP